MFTVCPKCALTLVVTAADLRVAQGYVRCGRCSNVFNALARLSEDRNAAAAAAASQAAPSPSTTGTDSQPSQAAVSPARSPQATGSSTATRPATPDGSGTRPARPAGSAARSQPGAASPPSPPPTAAHEDVTPEDALEFNPAATDVDQVFVAPPPNPEWKAATGTFKSIILKGEEAGQAGGDGVSAARTADPGANRPRAMDGSDEDEIELDPDFLSATAEMRNLKMGLSDSDTHPKVDESNMAVGGVAGAAEPQARQRTAPQGRTPLAGSAPDPSAVQAQFVPSPRAVPRGSSLETPSQPQVHAFLSETQSQPRPRSAPSDVQPHSRAPLAETHALPQPRPPAPGASAPPEPRAVSRPQSRGTVRAFGLDADPSPGRLANLARSRIATAPVEVEPPRARELMSSATLWSAGVGALVILLAAQIVNHYRNDLAATAQFNRPITALYTALGIQLTPRWDVHAYDVRQLGASVGAENAGQIMVRASVKNGGQQAQPMPLLRVTLQDRFGNRIAARDVPPGNYLPRSIPAASLLSAGQRIDAEMAFVDPGSNAVGFEIDACLPAPAGGVACANDPASR
jgi:predicted Zn finger-like uncharacterized protein